MGMSFEDWFWSCSHVVRGDGEPKGLDARLEGHLVRGSGGNHQEGLVVARPQHHVLCHLRAREQGDLFALA